ncbi:MAG: hypothetical protein CM15mP111_1040 [Hyphomicrobiales bacterium]|nr:MAG: hypothetical protein CM15mP111_1040 [Hyphomicrobiales bacterium]
MEGETLHISEIESHYLLFVQTEKGKPMLEGTTCFPF